VSHIEPVKDSRRLVIGILLAAVVMATSDRLIPLAPPEFRGILFIVAFVIVVDCLLFRADIFGSGLIRRRDIPRAIVSKFTRSSRP